LDSSILPEPDHCPASRLNGAMLCALQVPATDIASAAAKLALRMTPIVVCKGPDMSELNAQPHADPTPALPFFRSSWNVETTMRLS
jgi:hypothetical protein